MRLQYIYQPLGLKAHVDTWCDADFAMHCCFLNIYYILENNSYSFSHENLLQISTFNCVTLSKLNKLNHDIIVSTADVHQKREKDPRYLLGEMNILCAL